MESSSLTQTVPAPPHLASPSLALPLLTLALSSLHPTPSLPKLASAWPSYGTPSSSWEPLGETFYRKEDVYDMQWSLRDLSDHIVVGARWGGPLAAMRDDRKPVLLGSGFSGGKPKISIYSAAGALIQTIAWDAPSRIVQLGWTLTESLVVLTQDGTYRLYALSTVSPAPYTQHSLGPDTAEAGVLEAKIYEEGMVVLLGSLQFVEVKGWEKEGSQGGRVTSLAPAGLTERPSCWCVIRPEVSSSRGVEVVIGTERTVLRLDEIEVQDQRISRGPFLSIAASPNGRFLSLLSATSAENPHLWVASSDFTRSLSEFDLGAEGESGAPGQAVWCGNNTVVVGWERTVVMVGPFGETLKYFYSDPVYLLGEVDGTRIVSSSTSEFLHIVPQSSQDIFRSGSASPAAILFEAAELFERRSPKADEHLRNIRPDLISAVDTCIDAAGRESNPVWQKKLLRAASFGKTFLQLYNPVEFVQMTQTLRVLNAARDYQIGIPLTYDQYVSQPPTHLIARLNARSQHLLSLRISSFLHLSPAPVLQHWAQAKIVAAQGAEAEDTACKLIVEKLKSQSDVSCADVAVTAWTEGKASLATKLLEHEVRASKQVPLLLHMNQGELALVKAIESGDPDLVYTVLLRLKRSHALGDFFRLVDRKPEAAALLKVYAREHDVEMLRDFYYQDDRRRETGALCLEESWAEVDLTKRVDKVKAAGKAFADDKDCAFEAKIMDDHAKLLALQQQLEQEAPGKSFVGASVSETIRLSILANLSKKADKVRSDFKVPDKRFWFVKMKALVEMRDWEGLEAFAKSKKSPIGYEPFVEHLLSTGSLRQAVSYVVRCEQRNRIELYVKCGEWVLAGQEAARRQDRGKVLELQGRAPNNVIAAQLEEISQSMEHMM